MDFINMRLANAIFLFFFFFFKKKNKKEGAKGGKKSGMFILQRRGQHWP
jgi:hypothetical protein